MAYWPWWTHSTSKVGPCSVTLLSIQFSKASRMNRNISTLPDSMTLVSKEAILPQLDRSVSSSISGRKIFTIHAKADLCSSKV